MQLKVNHFYKTRDGRKAEVVYINEGLRDTYMVSYVIEREDQLHSCNPEGYYRQGRSKSLLDLISEWVEPLRVTGWYSVYQYKLVGPYDTEEDAESSKFEGSLGQIYIDQEIGK